MTVKAKSQDIYVSCTLCNGSGRDPLPQNFLDNCPLCNGTKFEIVGLNMAQVEMFRKGYEQASMPKPEAKDEIDRLRTALREIDEMARDAAWNYPNAESDGEAASRTLTAIRRKVCDTLTA